MRTGAKGINFTVVTSEAISTATLVTDIFIAASSTILTRVRATGIDQDIA